MDVVQSLQGAVQAQKGTRGWHLAGLWAAGTWVQKLSYYVIPATMGEKAAALRIQEKLGLYSRPRCIQLLFPIIHKSCSSSLRPS